MSMIPFAHKSNLAGKSAYDPFHSFRHELDKLFEGFSTALPTKLPISSLVDFKIDVSETDKAVLIKAELPGVEEKDIDVSVNEDVITIRGEKKAEKEEKEKSYHLVESSYGSFSRSLRLPFEPDAGKVSATYTNGVLNVSVEKPKAEKQSPQRIEVKKG